MPRLIASLLAAAALLCLAVPAMAAPVRPHSRTPVVLGTGLFDQILSWLGSLLPGHEAQPQGSREKTASMLGISIATLYRKLDLKHHKA